VRVRTAKSTQNDTTAEGNEQALLAEQIELLYSSIGLAALGNMVNAGILVAVQWPVIDHDTLLIWLASLTVLTFLRGVLLLAYRRDVNRAANARAWANRFLAGAALTALTWGSAAILLFPPESVPHQVFLAFVLAGMSAGATTSLSFLQTPITVFLGLTLLPLAARFFQEQTPLATAMGAMTILFLFIILLSGRRIFESTRQNIGLRVAASQREAMLRESEERYRTIFESAPLGIIHFDADGQILSSNEGAAELFEVTPAMLAGFNLRRDSQDEKLRTALRSALSGRLGTYEGPANLIVGHTDTYIRGFFRSVRELDGEVLGGVGILVDISEDRRLQRLKNEFVSTVSHELRTPLTAVRGALSLLIHGIGGQTDPSARELLSNAQKNTERLVVLINDLLDIDKIEAGQMAFKLARFDVGALVEEAIRINEAYAQQFDVRLVLTAAPAQAYVNVDRDRLIQAITNVLSNAVKFSPPGAAVGVEVLCYNDFVRIAVSDRGPGIPPEFQPHVFERFTQHDGSNTRHVGGTGLGLSITKAIITKFDGQIHFSSAADKGTTFYIDLPRVKVGQPIATGKAS